MAAILAALAPLAFTTVRARRTPPRVWTGEARTSRVEPDHLCVEPVLDAERPALLQQGADHAVGIDHPVGRAEGASTEAARLDIRGYGQDFPCLQPASRDPELGLNLQVSAQDARQHLAMDLGYDYETCRSEAASRGYEVHIPRQGKERREHGEGSRPRRWVVERTHSWLNRSRRLLVRWQKKVENYLTFIHLACPQLIFGKLSRLSISGTAQRTRSAPGLAG